MVAAKQGSAFWDDLYKAYETKDDIVGRLNGGVSTAFAIFPCDLDSTEIHKLTNKTSKLHLDERGNTDPKRRLVRLLDFDEFVKDSYQTVKGHRSACDIAYQVSRFDSKDRTITGEDFKMAFNWLRPVPVRA